MTRRRIVMRAGAAVAVMFTGRLTWTTAAAPSVDVGTTSNDEAVLFLHDGRAKGAVPRALCTSFASRRVRAISVNLLTMPGFTRTSVLLDESRGALLLSLLDDGDSIVMESLLRNRGVANLVRRRHGAQVLLSARL